MYKDLFFPTPVYVKDIGSSELNKHLEESVLNLSKTDPGIKKSNKNGWHSRNDIYNMPEYKELLSLLFKMQNEIFKEEGLEPSPHIGNMWANINPKGGYNTSHIHSNSLWSGVYYIKTPNNCGKLGIKDPRAISLMTLPRYNKPLRSYQWRQFYYDAMAGRCIMFPAWLEHFVEPNQSNDLRISISFNFLQKK
jgi:uncharacterized protein (TIGR02466 family)